MTMRWGLLLACAGAVLALGGCQTSSTTRVTGPAEWGCLADTPTEAVAKHYLSIGFRDAYTGALIEPGADVACGPSTPAAEATPAKTATRISKKKR